MRQAKVDADESPAGVESEKQIEKLKVRSPTSAEFRPSDRTTGYQVTTCRRTILCCHRNGLQRTLFFEVITRALREGTD